MPTITLNRQRVEKAVGKKLPADKLKDRISMLGTDIESITDKEIIVEIFPNRPDMLSEQGLARALSSFIKHKPGLKKYITKKSSYKVYVDDKVATVRPFTACAVVRGLAIHEEALQEIIQLQEKLHTTFGRNRKKCAIGVYPLDKITFPITYTAEKPENIKFTPLDFKAPASAADILATHNAGKEYGYLLMGESAYPLFIDATKKILSMPPIINAEETGKVTTTTKNVFVECSGHHLPTLQKCLNIIVTALADMGGDIYEVDVIGKKMKFKSPNFAPESMPLDIAYINGVLGLQLTKKQMGAYLEQMGFGMQGNSVLIPPYRADVMHKMDLAEEVAIAHGYENIMPQLPTVATVGEELPLETFKSQVLRVLTGLGYLETNTYHLSSEGHQLIKTNNQGSQNKLVKVKNPASEEHAVLRISLIPSLLEVFSNNKHNLYPQLLCETGVVFEKGNKFTTETGTVEKTKLVMAVAGSETTYTIMKQHLDALFSSIGVTADYKKADYPPLIQGRSAAISVKGKSIGSAGEIHPQVLTNYSLEVPVAVCELDLKELRALFV